MEPGSDKGVGLGAVGRVGRKGVVQGRDLRAGGGVWRRA